MKIDAKLTAFALDELQEPERSTVARAVAASPDAQRYVDETRELARSLKNEFAAELDRTTGAHSPNLISIRDDPWFWSIARPLAIAAVLALCAIVVAVTLGTYRSHHLSIAAQRAKPVYEVEAEMGATPEASSEILSAATVPNPLPVQSLARVNRVVVAERASEPNGEMRVVEVIADSYRLHSLRESLLTPVLSRKPPAGVIGRKYELLFLDEEGHVIASASFYRAPRVGFVLQLSQHVPQNVPHNLGIQVTNALPGRWDSRVDYSAYAVLFPNWPDSIGYSPGA